MTAALIDSGEVSFRRMPALPAIMAGRTRQSACDARMSDLVAGHSEASKRTRPMLSALVRSRSTRTTLTELAAQRSTSSGWPSDTPMTSRRSSSARSRAKPRRKSRSAATTMTEILESASDKLSADPGVSGRWARSLLSTDIGSPGWSRSARPGRRRRVPHDSRLPSRSSYRGRRGAR